MNAVAHYFWRVLLLFWSFCRIFCQFSSSSSVKVHRLLSIKLNLWTNGTTTLILLLVVLLLSLLYTTTSSSRTTNTSTTTTATTITNNNNNKPWLHIRCNYPGWNPRADRKWQHVFNAGILGTVHCDMTARMFEVSLSFTSGRRAHLACTHGEPCSGFSWCFSDLQWRHSSSVGTWRQGLEKGETLWVLSVLKCWKGSCKSPGVQ